MDVNWLAFVGVVVLAYVIPGPDFVVILRASAKGWRTGIAAALGAQLGLCAHVALAVGGLSLVLSRHPEFLTAIRVAGGLYLLYLAGRLVVPTLGTRPAPERTGSDSRHDHRSAFGQALFTNLLNPKAVLFFAAVLPQFIGGGAPTWAQVTVLGAVDVLLGVAVWAVVILVGVQLGRLLTRHRVRQWWDRVTGTSLGLIGGGLLVARD